MTFMVGKEDLPSLLIILIWQYGLSLGCIDYSTKYQEINKIRYWVTKELSKTCVNKQCERKQNNERNINSIQ